MFNAQAATLSLLLGRPLINWGLLGSFATPPWLGSLSVFTLIVAPDEALCAVLRLCSSAVCRSLSVVDFGGPAIVGYIRDVHLCSELFTDLKHTMVSDIFTNNDKS
jgi:hypothetical protein